MDTRLLQMCQRTLIRLVSPCRIPLPETESVREQLDSQKSDVAIIVMLLTS
ncbi:hypothetical protein [Amycolatopsis taiwanensis]|uniref:hypothetical protein n=1 Tax=Amycolatopsis taiwanensis TaxID=342230 RepID=UPI0004AF754E|nr:hypothetical protein [Amycolatopsis taiwanensis]